MMMEEQEAVAVMEEMVDVAEMEGVEAEPRLLMRTAGEAIRWLGTYDATRLGHGGRLTRSAPQLTTPLLPPQLFTAVTFHELFKEAALNGNEKLEFGIQWQEVLSELQASMTAVDDCSSYDEAVLRARFDEIDSSGDGSLDEDELLQVFEALGSPVTPNLIANLIRLADDDGAFLLNCSTGPAA